MHDKLKAIRRTSFVDDGIQNFTNATDSAWANEEIEQFSDHNLFAHSNSLKFKKITHFLCVSMGFGLPKSFENRRLAELSKQRIKIAQLYCSHYSYLVL